ncbi:MAG: hypothetical protein QGH15_07665 [Kiritimatiellia bacterium]|jgi:hypothetical protein|nr:hypothetical protein [Kiritimatiellia bacterium]
MQGTGYITICLFLALTSVVAHGYEEHVVVKRRRRLDNTTYEVMTRSDLRKLEYNNRREKIIQVKALAKAEKAWKEDPSNKGKSFPRSVVTSPDVRAMKGYRDLADATEEANRYTQQEKKRLAKQKKDLKEKYAVYQTARNSRDRGRRQEKRYDMERYNAALKRDEEREALLQKAADLYESVLEEVRAEYTTRRSKVRSE